MVQAIDHVTLRRSIELRVPPIVMTDPTLLLHNFPELCEYKSSPRKQKTRHSISNRSTKLRGEHKADNLESVPSGSEVIHANSGPLIPEVCSSPFDLRDVSEKFSIKEVKTRECFFSNESNVNNSVSPLSDSEIADDLFDLDYVLPDDAEWWQLGIDDVPLSPSNGNCGVVDVPQFGDSLGHHNLWTDVDSFVSVVDYDRDEVETSSHDRYEPVYRLDVRMTTIWGLDIIWEEEEDDADEDCNV